MGPCSNILNSSLGSGSKRSDVSGGEDVFVGTDADAGPRLGGDQLRDRFFLAAGGDDDLAAGLHEAEEFGEVGLGLMVVKSMGAPAL